MTTEKIDDGIASLILAMNDAGFVTFNSCSGLPGDHVGGDTGGFACFDYQIIRWGV